MKICKEYNLNSIRIEHFFGEKRYKKVSYPLKTGVYYLIEDKGTKLFFDLNGEIKFIHSRDLDVNPNEFVKRTKTNDFIFYSSGEYYGGIFDVVGEYYVPCFLYPSNNLWNRDVTYIINSAKSSWKNLVYTLKSMNLKEVPCDVRKKIENIIRIDERYLHLRAEILKKILNANITVLPPDTRHVDYDVIPIIISKGCLYNCRFCRVKSGDDFCEISKTDIFEQIKNLKKFYGDDIQNYSSIYLGLHDAFNCKFDTIKFAIEMARNIFSIEKSYILDRYIFLFASTRSFLNAKLDIFDYLNSIPNTTTIINIGLESACNEILKFIGKPIDSKEVIESFNKMVHINRSYLNIEITANFLIDMSFSEGHFESMINLIREYVPRPFYKGCVYLSPFKNIERNLILKKVMKLKRLSTLPMFLYIIQRF